MVELKRDFIVCPHCGNKTKTKVVPGLTQLYRFPLFCPRCKQVTMIDYGTPIRLTNSAI